MKKNFLTLAMTLMLAPFGLVSCYLADNPISDIDDGEQEPEEEYDPSTISVVADVTGEETTFMIGLGEPGKVTVDWGDGETEEYDIETTYDGLSKDGYYHETDIAAATGATINGVVKGEGKVKINTEQPVTGFKWIGNTSSDLHPVKAIRLKNATDLLTLRLQANALTEIDLSGNPHLLYINLSSNPGLTKLDLSNNLELLTLQCSNSGLTDVNLGKNNTPGLHVTLSGNQLEKLDVRGAGGLGNIDDISGYLLVDNNKLTEILHDEIYRLNVSKNRLTYAALHEAHKNVVGTLSSSWVYVPQQTIDLPLILPVGEVVDLSANLEAAGATPTVFTWKDADDNVLKEGDDYTVVAPGKFKFTKFGSVYCDMTNEEFPNFTRTDAYITTTANKDIVTLETSVDGATQRTLLIASETDENPVYVDWGDGQMVAVTSGTTASAVVGVPKGEGRVKVYGRGVTGLAIADASFVKTLDVHNASELTSLTANDGLFTTIDLSKNTSLLQLTLLNNRLAELVLTSNTRLNEVALSTAGATLTSLDLSKNSALKTFSFTGTAEAPATLENVSFGTNRFSSLTSIAFHHTNLKAFDLSSVRATTLPKITVDLSNNKQLASLKFISNGKAQNLYIDGDGFSFANLPVGDVVGEGGVFRYAPQQPVDIAAAVENTVDLGNQAFVGETATVFTWKTADGTALVEGTDYTVENGVTTFLRQPAGPVYAELANTQYPDLTGANALKTTQTVVTVK